MKKIIAVLLVVSMALLLIGCGAKRKGDVVLKREYTQTKDGKYEFDGRTFDYKATVENGSTEFTVLTNKKNLTFDDALKASVLSDDYAPGQTDDIVIVEHIVYKDAK